MLPGPSAGLPPPRCCLSPAFLRALLMAAATLSRGSMSLEAPSTSLTLAAADADLPCKCSDFVGIGALLPN